jgi:hypothetical protein
MNHYKTGASALQADTRIPAELSTLLEPLARGKVREVAFTFALPVTSVHRCAFCGVSVASIALHSGFEYDAEISTDANDITYAELTRLHRCPESIRFDEFLRSPDDEREDLP